MPIPDKVALWLGIGTLSGMGIVFHILNNLPIDVDIKQAIKCMLSELADAPVKPWPPHQTPFYAWFFGAVGLCASGLGFAVSGHYTAAATFFVIGWLCLCVSEFVGLAVFPRTTRMFWSTVAWSVSAVAFWLMYSYACPDFKVSPDHAAFQTWAGQSYTFHIANMSDDHMYMASFIFEITSQAYSVTDFTFNIPPESVKPLDQQPAQDNYKEADTFGLFGPLPSSHHFFLLNVYHFGPHEARYVTITLTQHVTSTETDFKILPRIMSYSRDAVPISKVNDFVLVPFRLDRPLTVTDFLPCWTGRAPACDEHPQLAKRLDYPEGCSYWGVSLKLQLTARPIHVRYPEHCD